MSVVSSHDWRLTADTIWDFGGKDFDKLAIRQLQKFKPVSTSMV
ncbi:hypothetical protein [Allocoleopsis franciscana]|nr:hypothetical protein [Allocoleopsis franciscana]